MRTIQETKALLRGSGIKACPQIRLELESLFSRDSNPLAEAALRLLDSGAPERFNRLTTSGFNGHVPAREEFRKVLKPQIIKNLARYSEFMGVPLPYFEKWVDVAQNAGELMLRSIQGRVVISKKEAEGVIVPLLKGLSNDENRKLLVAQGILQAFTGAKLLKAVVGNYRYTVGEMGARFAGCKEILGT